MFFNRKKMAEKLGIARSTLYYESKKEEKDEEEKLKIQEIMDSNPSYGHRRIALALSCNKKKALRLMNKFGLKPKISPETGAGSRRETLNFPKLFTRMRLLEPKSMSRILLGQPTLPT